MYSYKLLYSFIFYLLIYRIRVLQYAIFLRYFIYILHGFPLKSLYDLKSPGGCRFQQIYENTYSISRYTRKYTLQYHHEKSNKNVKMIIFKS